MIDQHPHHHTYYSCINYDSSEMTSGIHIRKAQQLQSIHIQFGILNTRMYFSKESAQRHHSQRAPKA
jgi:hypothetical protein